MTQQWSLAKKDKKSDWSLANQEIRCRNGHWLTQKRNQMYRNCHCVKDIDKKSKGNDKHTTIPTSVAAFFVGEIDYARLYQTFHEPLYATTNTSSY